MGEIMESNELKDYVLDRRKKDALLAKARSAALLATLLFIYGCNRNEKRTSDNLNDRDNTPGIVSVECVEGKEHKFEKMLEPCDDALNEVYPNVDGTNVCSGRGLQWVSKCAICNEKEPNSEIKAYPYKAHKPSGKGNEIEDKCTECGQPLFKAKDDWCVMPEQNMDR